MKINQLLAICGAVTALFLGVAKVSAQNGGGGGGFGGGGGRNFDPAQFQQRMMDRVRTSLNFTNDNDWAAVQPLVQKVMDARRDVGFGGGMGGFGGQRRNRNGGDQNGGGNGGNGGGGGARAFFGTPSPEQQALQDALDNNAPDDQVKNLLAKYKASQKAKQDKLKTAQEALRAVLDVRQEAQATMMGLVD